MMKTRDAPLVGTSGCSAQATYAQTGSTAPRFPSCTCATRHERAPIAASTILSATERSVQWGVRADHMLNLTGLDGEKIIAVLLVAEA